MRSRLRTEKVGLGNLLRRTSQPRHPPQPTTGVCQIGAFENVSRVVSRLRFVPGQHMVEITTRTQHGRLLLRPGPVFNDIFYGILGRAQRRYGMTIHYAAVLSNHYHLLVSVRDAGQLALDRWWCRGRTACSRDCPVSPQARKDADR